MNIEHAPRALPLHRPSSPWLSSGGCCTFPGPAHSICHSPLHSIQALEVAQPPLLDLLSRPGWAGTLLVPTDAAFDAALAAHPAVMRDPALLQQVGGRAACNWWPVAV